MRGDTYEVNKNCREKQNSTITEPSAFVRPAKIETISPTRGEPTTNHPNEGALMKFWLRLRCFRG